MDFALRTDNVGLLSGIPIQLSCVNISCALLQRVKALLYMKNNSIFRLFALMTVVCWQFSCINSPIEKVEHKNDQGQLERFERRKKDFAKEGLYQRFSEKGELLEEAQYSNDSLDGERKYFYANGKVKEKVMLHNNDENGPFTEYYENGAIKAEGNYIPGEDVPLEQGELREYDETGQLIRIADCQSGICHTKWKKE